MPLDDQIRQSAEALASDLGREIQERFGRLALELAAAATAERDAALAAQAQQQASEADARAHDEVAKARAEAAAELELAMTQARSDAAVESAHAIAKAREDASSEAATLVARAREEVAQVTARLEADQDDRQAESDRLALEREMSERHALLAEMERLVESFRRLDAADTLRALLDALAESSSHESARTAVFLVRGQQLQGWRFWGFADAPSDARQVTVPFESAGGLADAVQRRARAEVHAFAAAGALGFIALPGGIVGVAVPVMVGGDVAAVVYGDDGAAEERVVPAGWPESLELLSRHASRCLEAQTAMRAARFGGVAPPPGLARATDSPVDAGVSAGR